MKNTLLNGIICLLTIAFTSCNEKNQIKDIATTFPDRIELKYSAIKGLDFFPDTTEEGKSVRFDDLGIIDSTFVFISQMKNVKIQSIGSDTSTMDVTNWIPCCSTVRYYENVPVRISCKICFQSTQPFVDDNSGTYKSVKKEFIETKKNGVRLRFTCFDGAIIVNTGKIRCERCPGSSQFCSATYILYGHEYPANFAGTPDEKYFTRREQGTHPCGNCPPDACTNKSE